MLKELIAKEETAPSISRTWRASEAGECETWLGRSRLRHPVLPFSGRVRHMLQDGQDHERDIVQRMTSKGIKVMHSCLDGQIDVRGLSNPHVSGHPDGILELDHFNFDLDYADGNFKPSTRMLLEITAPSHFSFIRLKANHFRSAWWRKYVQIQLYLNSDTLRACGNSCVVVVKNRNTAELYEEGISLDEEVVAEVAETLLKVEALADSGKVSSYRCSDWRTKFCRYRHLCYEEEVVPAVALEGILKGESLKEASELLEAAAVWRQGKVMVANGDEMVQEARNQFWAIIEDYGCRGLTVEEVRALMVDSTKRSVNYDLLRAKYPDVYSEVVSTKSTRYVRVA